MSLDFYCEEEENYREESINKYKFLFSKFDKKAPSLKEALTKMYERLNLDKKIIDEMTREIIDGCKDSIDSKFDAINFKYDNITKEDAYIICSYTCELQEKYKMFSPYKILNQNLVENDRKKGVRNVSEYFYILLKSLRKLPRYYPKDNGKLYRCLTRQVNISQDNNNNSNYFKGKRKTFWPFTSTSADPTETYKFLNKGQEMKSGTLFILKGDLWGYDIELFNIFGEKEILLEPERKYIIEDVLPAYNGVIQIECKMIKSNPVLSDFNDDETNLIFNNNNVMAPKQIINNSIDNDNLTINDYLAKFDMDAKINGENKFTSGIGILCNIPLKNIKVFITYNHMINFDFLNKGEKMCLYINNKEKEINLKLNRYKYTNEELNITIIEILDTDNIKSFIDIDKYLTSRNYVGKNILFISLNDNEDFESSFGKIKEKNEDNYICNIESQKEGIVILKDNMKLIGIVKKNKDINEINIIPMNVIINKISFIKGLYKITKKDKGKQVQIMNNKIKIIKDGNKSGMKSDTDIQKTNEKENTNESKNNEMKNKMTTIINGEILSDIFSYEFKIEGIYNIYYLSFDSLSDLSYMFYNCEALEKIDLSSLNTDKVTDMSYMFGNCSSLKEINFSSVNTSLVTNMSYMFCKCSSLIKLDLSSFDTKQVINMTNMFSFCSSMKALNLSTFKIDQVTDMTWMFYNCTSLEKLDLSSFSDNKVKNMAYMFNGCNSLKELNISNLKTNQVSNMTGIFIDCNSLIELDLSSFNTEEVIDMSFMFYNCDSLEKLNISSFNTKKVADMSSMFNNCSALKEINLSSFFTESVTDMSNMFNSCSSLKDLNLGTFKTYHVTDMSYMFYECSSLEKLNLKCFDTSQVIEMPKIFFAINKSCKLECKDEYINKEFNS